jgi:hypothetical protein
VCRFGRHLHFYAVVGCIFDCDCDRGHRDPFLLLDRQD